MNYFHFLLAIVTQGIMGVYCIDTVVTTVELFKVRKHVCGASDAYL